MLFLSCNMSKERKSLPQLFFIFSSFYNLIKSPAQSPSIQCNKFRLLDSFNISPP